jgi:uncharacterized membrane protein
MRKVLIITLLAMILTVSMVAAATTLSSLTLQADSGASTSGTVTATSDSSTGTLILTSSNLISGNNTISTSDITIDAQSAGPNPLIQGWTVTVDVPTGQPSGTYSGILTVTDNGTVIATSFINILITNVVQGASFTLSDLDFGDSSQIRGETINSNLKIVNTGSEPLTISLSSNAASSYLLTFSQPTINVASGQTIDVPATLYVPDNQDSGRKNIGSVTAVATNAALTKTSAVNLQTKSELVITRVKAVIDGKSSTLDDGEDVDAKPGDDVTLTITLKNEYDDDIYIEDVNLDVLADNDLDWDDSTDFSRIKYGDKKDVDFSFTIPSDIDEDNYDVDITADGRDENGARHQFDYSITINVDRQSHEISINSVSVNPTRVSCDDQVTLRTRIENTGNNDEDNVAIAFQNDELGLEEYLTRLVIDQGDILDKSVYFTVPKNIPSGEYIIDITTYYDNKESDYGVASLYIDSCGSTGTTTTGTGTTTTGNTNTGTTSSTTPPVIIPTGTVGPSMGTAGFLNSTTYMIILVAAALLLLILIILLLVKFVF